MTCGRTNHTRFAGLASKDIPDHVTVGRGEVLQVVDGKMSAVLVRCVSDSDGDCNHTQCPQHRDKEPETTGRSCPLYNWDDTRT